LGPLGEVEPALDSLDVEGDGVGVRGARRPSVAHAQGSGARGEHPCSQLARTGGETVGVQAHMAKNQPVLPSPAYGAP
jgi:hypothetical protein